MPPELLLLHHSLLIFFSPCPSTSEEERVGSDGKFQLTLTRTQGEMAFIFARRKSSLFSYRIQLGSCWLSSTPQMFRPRCPEVWNFPGGASQQFLFFFFNFIFFLIIFFICSGFCHTLKWNSHGFTYVPHPDPPSHLPLHPIPLGLPSAPGPSACLMHPTWAGDYSAIKKNSFESVLMRWMKLEPIIQSEVSQKDKDHYNILTHIYGI